MSTTARGATRPRARRRCSNAVRPRTLSARTSDHPDRRKALVVSFEFHVPSEPDQIEGARYLFSSRRDGQIVLEEQTVSLEALVAKPFVPFFA